MAEFNNENNELIYGRNGVLEALKAKRPINKILFCGEMKGSMTQKRILL